MKSAKREGFSLIEMIIAIAIIGIVMSGVILLISYGTNSMRRTSNQVNLQNQAKDALTHMTTHLQESTGAKFYDDGTTQALIAVRAKGYENGEPTSAIVDIYWKGTYQETAKSEKENVIYYVQWNYPGQFFTDHDKFNESDRAQYLSPKGDFKADEFLAGTKTMFDGKIADGTIFEGEPRSCILCRDVTLFKEGADGAVTTLDPAATESPTPAPGGDPTPSPTPAATASAVPVSAKNITFTLKLKNKTGDTTFKTTKTIYLRNQ